MDSRLRQERIQDCQQTCRDLGVPFTVQRRAILEAVLDLDNHPTADQVYAHLSERTPDISRTTVYRTLETLVRIGSITKACHPGSVVRYDPHVEIHHHLICQSCDQVIDITDEKLDALPIPDTSPFGFEVSDFRVQLRGTCSRCREKEES